MPSSPPSPIMSVDDPSSSSSQDDAAPSPYAADSTLATCAANALAQTSLSVETINAITTMVAAAMQQPNFPSTTDRNASPQSIIRLTNWSDLPELKLSVKRDIDAWFVQFESKLKAHGIFEDKYLGFFDACPRVSPDIKTKFLSDSQTYAALRMNVLREYGPLFPETFFINLMYKIRGNTREPIKEELQKLKVLHNRVMRDLHRHHTLTDADLIYPFINAFPEDSQQALLTTLIGASRDQNPLEFLFMHAPTNTIEMNTTLCRMEQGKTDSPTASSIAPQTATPPTDTTETVQDAFFCSHGARPSEIPTSEENVQLIPRSTQCYITVSVLLFSMRYDV